MTQWPVRNLNVHCFVISRPGSAALARLERDPRVKWTQPFNEFAVQSVPDFSAMEPGARVTHFASRHPSGGAGMKLAVVDTSVDHNHKDLATSRIRQRDFVGEQPTAGGEAHGTAVVGLIAANASSPDGVQGLASKAQVDVLRACWQAGSGPGKCNTLTLALALDAAVDLDPDVLNLSLTGGYDRILQTLIERLVDSGTLVVAAYDEEREAGERFPAPLPGLVYAYGHTHPSAAGSQDMANQAVVTAPREAFTLAPENGYDIVSGHSIAAPQVAAAAACLRFEHPGASPAEIQHMLQRWMTDPG